MQIVGLLCSCSGLMLVIPGLWCDCSIELKSVVGLVVVQSTSILLLFILLENRKPSYLLDGVDVLSSFAVVGDVC